MQIKRRLADGSESNDKQILTVHFQIPLNQSITRISWFLRVTGCRAG